tara:strand:+ start:333 stop:1718 length:1386 start_codon:yes stop_codon:yes gene_type:complete
MVGSQDAFAVLEEVEAAFGLDPDFPARRNLVEKLIELLATVEPSAQQTSWMAALKEARQAGEKQKEKLGWFFNAATKRGGNPIGGSFVSYPLPAFFLQPKPHSLGTAQYLALNTLFLTALLLRPNGKFESIADTCRKAISPKALGSGAHALINTLPSSAGSSFLSDIESFLSDVTAAVENERHAQTIKAISSLWEICQTGARKEAEPAQTKPLPEAGPHRWFRQQTTGTTEEGRRIGSHIIHVVEPDKTDSPSGDELATVELFMVEPDVVDEQTPPPSETEVEIAAKETRYWISRHQRLTANDPGRFTSIERRRLASSLSEWMISKDRRTRIGAGIVALMYVTGLGWETIFGATLGNDGQFGADGCFRRNIRLPVAAYEPPSDVAALFEPRGEKLNLLLPPAVATWMQAHFKSSDGLLLDCLGVEKNEARDCLDDVLVRLRHGGLFQRIRLERITESPLVS